MAYTKKSRYLRDSSDTEEKNTDAEKETDTGRKSPEYRKGVITPKRARELAESENAETLEADVIAEEETEEASESALPNRKYRSNVITPKNAAEIARKEEEAAISAENEGEDVEQIKRHGTDADMLKGETSNEKKFAYSRESVKAASKERKTRAFVRMLFSMVLLTLLAGFLQLMAQEIPFTKGAFTTELSTVPELIAAIAYGPVFGVIICLIKSVFFILVSPQSSGSLLTGFALDTVFILLASVSYSKMITKRNKKLRANNKRIASHYSASLLFACSAASAVVSTIPQFFITKYISYPLLSRFISDNYSEAKLLEVYRIAGEGFNSFLSARTGFSFPKIDSVTKGILFFNIPITFFKLIAASVIAAILLRFTIRFLNSVKRRKKSK